MKLIEDRILVRELPKKEKTTAGILLLDTTEAVDSQPRATVIEKGEKAVNVEKGDILIVGKYSGTDLVLNGITYKIIREGDILLIE